MDHYEPPQITVLGSLRDLTQDKPEGRGSDDHGRGRGGANGKSGGGGDGVGFVTLGKSGGIGS